MTSAGLSNRGGSISQWGTSSTKLALPGALDNRNGQITANGEDLSVTSTALDNTSGKIEHAGAGVLRLSTGLFDNADGTLATNGTMRVSADSGRNDRGTVSAQHALYLLTHGLMSNQVGLIQSGGLFSLDAGALHNDGGRLLALSDAEMRINVSRELLNASCNDTQGEIAGKGDVAVTAGNAINSGRWASDGTFRFETAGSLLNTGGQILARQHVVLAVGNVLDNSGGKLDTAGHLDTSANTIRNVRGQMSSARLTMNAVRLDNDTGEIVQSDPQGDAPAHLNITEALSNRTGAIKLAARDARIETRTFDNTSGTVAHAGDGNRRRSSHTIRAHCQSTWQRSTCRRARGRSCGHRKKLPRRHPEDFPCAPPRRRLQMCSSRFSLFQIDVAQIPEQSRHDLQRLTRHRAKQVLVGRMLRAGRV